tara:strand:- start:2877 stop:3212 length:336 start_codon:yes stop_codon:yes gene_type:complete
MDDNSLLMIILAFILGCMCSGMMKQMCGCRLVEGFSVLGVKEEGESCTFDVQCKRTLKCDGGSGRDHGYCRKGLEEDDGIIATATEDVFRGHLFDTDDSLLAHVEDAVQNA